MTPEQRLDPAERILLLAIKAGARERKETREKINALIDAQIRTEATLERFEARTEESLARFEAHTDDFQAHTQEFLFRLEEAQLHTEEALSRLARGQERLKAAQVRTEDAMVRLAQAQASTDERLNSFIGTIDRIIQERRNGNP